MPKDILIIDNDEMNRGLLRLVLEYDGWHCVEALDGAMGLAMLGLKSYDVVILDHAMPGMTGMEFLNHLQQTSQNPHIPVIMFTGFLNPDFREKATRLGAYAIIEKPYDFGKLRSMVAQVTLSPASQTHPH